MCSISKTNHFSCIIHLNYQFGGTRKEIQDGRQKKKWPPKIENFIFTWNERIHQKKLTWVWWWQNFWPHSPGGGGVVWVTPSDSWLTMENILCSMSKTNYFSCRIHLNYQFSILRNQDGHQKKMATKNWKFYFHLKWNDHWNTK